MGFNPSEYFINLKGKQYLQVAHRLQWFREDHPIEGKDSLRIITDTVSDDGESAVVVAEIYNSEGQLLARGRKREAKREFHDYLEKAETGAIGRALAIAGYGTQFAQELELPEEKVVDAPFTPKPPSKEELEKKRQEAIELAKNKANGQLPQNTNNNAQENATKEEQKDVKLISDNQIKAINNLLNVQSKKLGDSFNKEEFVLGLLAEFGKGTIEELSDIQAREFIVKINHAGKG
jgi:hypothetical protein